MRRAGGHAGPPLRESSPLTSFCHARLDRASSVFVLVFLPRPKTFTLTFILSHQGRGNEKKSRRRKRHWIPAENHSPLEGESQKPSRQAPAEAVGGSGAPAPLAPSPSPSSSPIKGEETKRRAGEEKDTGSPLKITPPLRGSRRSQAARRRLRRWGAQGHPRRWPLHPLLHPLPSRERTF